MRIPSLLVVPFLMGLVAPVAAQGLDPVCLFFDAHMGPDAYTGSAFPVGGAGSVVDKCASFPTSAWEALIGLQVLDGADAGNGRFGDNGTIGEVLRFGESRNGFALWTGAPSSLYFQFFLAGQEVHHTGWLKLTPGNRGGEIWGGEYDEVRIGGAYVLTLSTQGAPPAIDDEWEVLGDDADPLPGQLLDPGAASVVPEPATLTLLGTGLVGLAGAARRRKAANSDNR